MRDASESLLRLLHQETRSSSPARVVADRVAASPTMVLVDDVATREAETLAYMTAQTMDDIEAENRTSAAIERNRGTGIDEEGQPVLNGRRCCYRLALDANRRMHQLRLPTDLVCECGTRWRVEIRAREERRHGR